MAGWHSAQDPEGDAYYWHDDGRSTSWDLPDWVPEGWHHVRAAGEEETAAGKGRGALQQSGGRGSGSGRSGGSGRRTIEGRSPPDMIGRGALAPRGAWR